MLKIYACDDQKKQLDLVVEYIQKAILMQDMDAQFQFAADTPEKLLEQVCNSNDTGLYFLDVDLRAEMNGFQLANEIRKHDPRGFIVFITTHSEMSYYTFKYGVEAMDYIVKDFPDEIEKSIYQDIMKAYERYDGLQTKKQGVLAVKTEGRTLYVEEDSILYIESSDIPHKLDIHTESEVIGFYGSLKDLASDLGDKFFRCHKSFIIQLSHIREIRAGERMIVMSNGDICPASVQFYKKLVNKLEKHVD